MPRKHPMHLKQVPTLSLFISLPNQLSHNPQYLLVVVVCLSCATHSSFLPVNICPHPSLKLWLNTLLLYNRTHTFTFTPLPSHSHTHELSPLLLPLIDEYNNNNNNLLSHLNHHHHHSHFNVSQFIYCGDYSFDIYPIWIWWLYDENIYTIAFSSHTPDRCCCCCIVLCCVALLLLTDVDDDDDDDDDY